VQRGNRRTCKHYFARVPLVLQHYAFALHTDCNEIAALIQLPSGYWSVQVRLKAQYSSKTCVHKAEVENWAEKQE